MGLIKPDFTVEELKLLIKFIYKSLKNITINELNLYYNNSLYSEIYINDMNKTMKDLAKEKNSNIEFEIKIQTQY